MRICHRIKLQIHHKNSDFKKHWFYFYKLVAMCHFLYYMINLLMTFDWKNKCNRWIKCCKFGSVYLYYYALNIWQYYLNVKKLMIYYFKLFVPHVILQCEKGNTQNKKRVLNMLNSIYCENTCTYVFDRNKRIIAKMECRCFVYDLWCFY